MSNQRREIVLANRILYTYGVVDAFGHVSVRDEKDPEAFLLARNIAPAQVTEDDVVRYRFDGSAADGDDRKPYLERFIHASVFKARPDVGAVVHSHAPEVIPFGLVAEQPLRPVWHMSAFLAGPVPIFEIADVEGDATDMLIRSVATADALAGTLGSGTAVLMRGHGATIAGRTIREAVFRAVFLAMNAQVQSEALRLGTPRYLTAKEAEAATATIGSQIDRAWNLWAEDAADED